MSQTKEGAAKAVATTRQRHGKDFFKKAGAIGGSRLTPTGGFGAKASCVCKDIIGPHHKAQCAGRRGGLKRQENKLKVAAGAV